MNTQPRTLAEALRVEGSRFRRDREHEHSRPPVPRAVPRLAEEAVARARLTVVPRRRVRAARMPFVTLVSLVLLGGVVGLLCFNTPMQQASFAATKLEAQATASPLASRPCTTSSRRSATRSASRACARGRAWSCR